MTKRRSRRGAYRMTPARRAALHKAQLASARKRRKANFIRGAKVVGAAAGGLAVYAANAHLQKYAANPRAAVKDYRDVKSFISRRRGIDPNAPKMPARKPIGYHKTSHKAIRRVAGRKVGNRSRLR